MTVRLVGGSQGSLSSISKVKVGVSAEAEAPSVLTVKLNVYVPGVRPSR